MEPTELRYARGSATSSDVQRAAAEVLAELDDENLGAQVVVKDEGQALDPATASVLVGIAGNVASHYLIKLWETRILPRIQDRLGDDALGAREDGD